MRSRTRPRAGIRRAEHFKGMKDERHATFEHVSGGELVHRRVTHPVHTFEDPPRNRLHSLQLYSARKAALFRGGAASSSKAGVRRPRTVAMATKSPAPVITALISLASLRALPSSLTNLFPKKQMCSFIYSLYFFCSEATRLCG